MRKEKDLDIIAGTSCMKHLIKFKFEKLSEV